MSGQKERTHGPGLGLSKTRWIRVCFLHKARLSAASSAGQRLWALDAPWPLLARSPPALRTQPRASWRETSRGGGVGFANGADFGLFVHGHSHRLIWKKSKINLLNTCIFSESYGQEVPASVLSALAGPKCFRRPSGSHRSPVGIGSGLKVRATRALGAPQVAAHRMGCQGDNSKRWLPYSPPELLVPGPLLHRHQWDMPSIMLCADRSSLLSAP